MSIIFLAVEWLYSFVIFSLFHLIHKKALFIANAFLNCALVTLGHSRSRSISQSPSPPRPSNSRIRYRSRQVDKIQLASGSVMQNFHSILICHWIRFLCCRSYSPAPKHRDDYSASPRRPSALSRSPRGYSQGRGEKQSHRSYSPKHSDGNRKRVDHHDFSALPRGKPPRRSRSPADYRERYTEDRRLRSYSPKSDAAERNGASYDYE